MMRTLKLAVIGVFLTSACSKAETDAKTEASSSEPAAAAPAGPTAMISDVCALITQAEAEGVLGKKLAPPQKQAGGDCWYMREGGTDFGAVEFILSVPTYVESEKAFDDMIADQTRRMNERMKKSGMGGVVNFTAEKAPGVGAPAYFIDPGLYVLKGKAVLAVGLGGEKGVSLAKIAVGRMP